MQSINLVRRGLRLVAAGVLLTGAVGFIACGDDDDDDGDATPVATEPADSEATADEQAIEETFADAFESWNADDLETFVTHFTDEGLISSFGGGEGTAEEAKAQLQGLLGSQDLALREFSDITVTGDTATADGLFSLGPSLLHSKFDLIKVDGEWKLKAEESNLPVEVPAGAESIPVDMNEFAFGTDVEAIAGASGEFALVAKNVGQQSHMLGLARIPADADVQALLQEENSPDVEFLAGVFDVAPGESDNVVFVKPLEAGRYIMVCFLPDTDEGEEGTPHVFKGMLTDFTVE